MATDLSNVNFTSMLKERYLGYFLQLMFTSSPVMGLFARKHKPGEVWNHTVSYGGGQNHGASYTKVRARKNKSQQKRFVVPIQEYFGQFSVDHKVLLASADREGAFVDAFVHEMGTALEEYSKEISQQLYRKSSGFKGVVSSVATGGGVDVITLSDRADIVMFSKDMPLIASANADGSSPRDSGTAKKVTKINVQEGKITLEGNIASLAANDYLFIDGNEDSLINGILDWIPDAAERASSGVGTFLTVDRTVHDSALAGTAIDGSSMSFEDALISASAECQFIDANPRVILMNPLSYQRLAKELSSKETIEKGLKGSGMAANIGYDTIKVSGINGSIVLDSHAPSGRAFFLDPNSWFIPHLGDDVVNDWDADSLKVLRDDSLNAINGQFVSYHNLICEAPKKNLVLTLPSS
jgi:hypothetical protein